MNPSSLALLSILVGIIAANIFAYLKPKYSFDAVGNSIAGVFGSVLLIKSFGRLGFSPTDIVDATHFKVFPFILNMLVSAIGAVAFLFFVVKLKTYFDRKSK